MLKKLGKHFLRGLAFLLPIALTVYVIYYIITIPKSWFPNAGALSIVIGVVSALVIIALIGFLSSSAFSGVFNYFDRLLSKVPLVKIVFTSIKDLTSAFMGDKKKFDKPVLVKVSKELDIERLGFITKEDLSDFGITDTNKIGVYLPYSYGMMGKFIIVPKENVTTLDNVSASATMKFVISGGVTSIGDDENEEESKS